MNFRFKQTFFDCKSLYTSAVFKSVVLNLSWFLAPFQRLSTLVALCSSIKTPSFVLGCPI